MMRRASSKEAIAAEHDAGERKGMDIQQVEGLDSFNMELHFLRGSVGNHELATALWERTEKALGLLNVAIKV